MGFPGTLDDLYLPWLYAQVDVVRPRRTHETYWELLKQMYSMEFTWFVPNDDDRAADGRALRYEWAEAAGTELDTDWTQLECSFLEMLVALSRRLEFQTDAAAANWFWRLIGNLGFSEYHDASGYSKTFVTTRIRKVMDRMYDANGNGGLFPLAEAEKDQRRIDIWYQMHGYLAQEE